MVAFSFNTWNHSAVWGLRPSLPMQIRAAAEAGYDYVGLDIPSLSAHRDAGLRPSAIRSLLDRYEINCYELVALSVSSDPFSVAPSLQRCVEMAAVLGVRSVLAVARGPFSESLVNNTRRCAETLGEMGVSMALEFLPVCELDSIEATQRLIEAAGTPTLKMVVDSWHFFEGPSSWAALEALEACRLGFIQFSDASPPSTSDPQFEYRHRRVLPGDGIHDLRRFAEMVLPKKPDVVVSMEVLSDQWRRRLPAQFAAACLASSRPFWQPECPLAVGAGSAAAHEAHEAHEAHQGESR
jgi:sugar phosphate isomerase/epimerase